MTALDHAARLADQLAPRDGGLTDKFILRGHRGDARTRREAGWTPKTGATSRRRAPRPRSPAARRALARRPPQHRHARRALLASHT